MARQQSLHIERRNALEASANELFEVVASGKVRINVHQRFALKDAANAHKALEARATTERVFRNLAAVLKAAGKSFDHVARAGVYLTNMSDFVAMNGIYAKYFSQPFPARTTIAVAALPLGACVEIDLVVKA
jgi:2-iminobutanoate/2-iminopropanoate deaminase